MRFIVSSSALFNRLQTIGRVINSKNTLPILDCFLFEIQDNILTITASDSETTLITNLELVERDANARFCINAKTIQDSMKEIAEHAGVTNRCYPHKMRKTLGMELKNRGVDIGTIQEVLGHADSKVTSMYYAQSTPDTLRMIRKRAV